MDRHGSEYNVEIVFKNTRSGLVVYGNALVRSGSGLSGNGVRRYYSGIFLRKKYLYPWECSEKVSEVSVGILNVRRCSIVPEIVENLHTDVALSYGS